jgi:NADPH:quinone reductase-like Zn-dependent oxidoreductase
MDVPTSDSVPRPTVTIADAIGFLSRYSPVLAGALAGWAWSAGASLAFCSILFAVGLLVSAIVSIAAIDANLGLLRKGHASSDTFMDKTVLIVGASRGVGAALAQHLANQGAILILASRNEADLQV